MDETESLTRVYESHAPDEAKSPPITLTSYDGDPAPNPFRPVCSRRRSSSPASPTKRTKVDQQPQLRNSRAGSGSSAAGQEPFKSPEYRGPQDRSGQTTPRSSFDRTARYRPPLQRPYSSPYLQLSAPLPGYTDQAAWPLGAVEEAKLVRYYVVHIANWFDVCDQRRHFATVLPQRAAFCPPLMCAIFTVAAHHLSLRNALDPYIAHRYHEKCLEYLKHVIYDETAVVDENLFAAIIVLRFLEEVDGIPMTDLLAMHY
jgi:Fungal specific transcription factor domain